MRTALLVLSLFIGQIVIGQPAGSSRPGYVLVIHGGAGTIRKSTMTPEKERAYRAALDSALARGQRILAAGGKALDAVEAAVRTLEDDPLFNAGKGAVFTNQGINELDAAVMDGATLAAGSVSGVRVIRNPVTAARAVMEQSEHVMLSGSGAEEFARLKKLELVDPSYFYTAERWKGLLEARKEDSLASLNQRSSSSGAGGQLLRQPGNHDQKYGTVGAVALDRSGNLAAATSTGGMTNKKWGRVGDAPIIGSGTYANNATVAISCTGWGEYFIRLRMAGTISDMMEFGHYTLGRAATEMIMERLVKLGGDGGLIAVDRDGNIALPFCTEGMYRGFVREGEKRTTAIYKSE